MSGPATADRGGHRGYIGSRPYFGDRAPQHVQNLVIRDYCQRYKYQYLLSVTEYAMPGCYMMLEEAVREAPRLSGLVLYSLFMLPARRERRLDVYERLLGAGATLHGALEDLTVAGRGDIQRIEDIWRIKQLTHNNASPPGTLVQA
ncbi:MAG: sporadic carbohydrate cluster protein, TIGR04323 family [Alphaproteobacteria bacterium]|nr:sporadic carbohydrate cluster protein, TIGR04323 family [Alphaproteobacteria bacterium]